VTARVVVTARPTDAQIATAVALLSGAITLTGKLAAAAGNLAAADVPAWVDARCAEIQRALDGAPVAESLARMVAAAITTTGVACEVLS